MHYNRPVPLASVGGTFLGLTATTWAIFGWSVAAITILFLILALARLAPRRHHHGEDE